MIVAKASLCKQLYNLTGWGKNQKTEPTELWAVDDAGKDLGLLSSGFKMVNFKELIPAYDLGFLMTKIVKDRNVRLRYDDGKFIATAPPCFRFEAKTPEDAVCKLAIKMFTDRGSK